MKKVKNFLKTIWQDESGQGATEYILLLVVVVGVALMFGPQIKGFLESKVGQVGGQIEGFTPDSF